MGKGVRRVVGGFIVCAVAASLAAPARAALTITPTFGSSITGDPNAASIEATINSVLQTYQNQFSNPVSVSVTFQEMTSGLGQSVTFINSTTYTNYRTALAAHATTPTDVTALAHLPVGTANPVNGNTSVTMALPLGRALGLSGFTTPGGQTDSTISLNMSIINITRPPGNSSHYDLFAVVAHELDEVLGTTSSLTGSGSLTGSIDAADLFRYDGSGNRSYTNSSTASAFFSVDGTTLLARYNQTSGGDFGDWFSPGGQTPQVQDAFGTPGATPNPGVEFTVLDAVGWTPTPEPASMAGITIAAGALLARRRRR